MYFTVVESSSESSTKRRDTPDIQSHGQVGNAVSMLATDQIFPVLYFIDPNKISNPKKSKDSVIGKIFSTNNNSLC